MSEARAYLPAIESIAREAGALILEGYRKNAVVSKKGRIDLVTQYDVAAERFILDAFAQQFPGLNVIGEETHGKGAHANDNDLAVYVDPIDGTTNFAHGHPFFCVSIGLCRGPRALAGVVFAPALFVCWKGVVGEGAMRNDEPCFVSQESDLEGALCGTGFSYDVVGSEDDNVAEFAAIQGRAQGVRRCGSAALDLTLVADGTYDFYWERGLQAWDMAAGAAIVLAAGGRISDYEGREADVRVGTMLASNGPLHESVLGVLRGARKV